VGINLLLVPMVTAAMICTAVAYVAPHAPAVNPIVFASDHMLERVPFSDVK
jgi:hypothetical protein